MPSKTKRRKKCAVGVDYGYATQMAREFIEQYKIDWLPIDPFELLDKLDIQYKSIGDLVLETGLDRKSLIDEVIFGEDGLIFYEPDTDSKNIILNEEIEPFERIRWTIMHEIGHAYLGHLNSKKTSILKWKLSKEEYDNHEQEAHIFAAEVLAPKFILYRIGALAVHEIMEICEISKLAAESRANAITELINDKTKMHDSMLLAIKPLSAFLEFKTVCCDKSDLKIQSKVQHNPIVHPVITSIDGLEKLPEGKYNKCPKCSNTPSTPKDNFCAICGETLYYKTPPETIASPCGYIGDKEARFCMNCGSRVYKTRTGLLFEKDEI